ncbi:MAG TPA: OmpA family protein [Bryobacteraceae bacterium]|nr:OmpA family protein [Bryobacteraceae bacterium]
MKSSSKLVWVGFTVLSLAAAGCAKKVAVAPPPPLPAATPAQAAPASRPSQPQSRPAATRPAPAQTAQNQRYPNAVTRARIDELLARIQDAYFDYDRHSLRPDALKALEGDSAELRDILAQYPAYKLTIEGHCDERGSAEYNMALGDARAKEAKDYLVGVGIPSDQLKLVSYGKERPVCDAHDEACWQKNRRVHIVAMAQ